MKKNKLTDKQIRKEVKPEEVAAETEIKKVHTVQEATDLQKHGYIVKEVLSAQIGVRPKTWILEKG